MSKTKGVLVKLDRGFLALLAREQTAIETASGKRPPRTNIMRELMLGEIRRRAEGRGETVPYAELVSFESDEVQADDLDEVTRTGFEPVADSARKAPEPSQDAIGTDSHDADSLDASERVLDAPSASAQVMIEEKDIKPVFVARAEGRGGFMGDIKMVGVTSGVARGE